MVKKQKFLLNCEVIHRTEGRIRVKSNAFKYVARLEEELENKIMDIKYIKSAKISTITGKILIYLNDYSISNQNIVSLLENTLSYYLVEIHKNESIENNSKYTIERKLYDESPKEILNKIFTTTGLLAYSFFKKAPVTPVTGISRIFNYMTLGTMSLAFPIVKNGVMSLVKNKRPNADTLSSTAIVSSIFLGKNRTALTIMILEKFAELLTAYTMQKTRGAIHDMLSVGESFVWKQLEDDTLKRVPIEEIKKGDIVVVKTGEKISVDGKITSGKALIDQSSITGEYMPTSKKENEDVYAGTIIKNGYISILAEKVGDERAVSRIIKLVEDANFNKAPIQSYADAFSAQLIPLNFLLAGIVYLTTRNSQKALSMLVIDYSCGIRLSTATAFSASINTAAKNGVLIKGSNFLEEMSEADTVIFDKTGTITEGNPKIQTIEILEKNITKEKLISLAAAAEETSSHPLATAILAETKDRGINIPKHKETKVVISRGIETIVGKDIIRVGSKKYMEENEIPTEASRDAVRGLIYRGEIIIYVSKGKKLIGVIGVTDPPKENIKKSINRLRNQGIDDIILLTGDLKQQAETISSRMSLDRYKADLMPEDKAKSILKIQSKGAKVIMIGDGINDAPALSYANVGIALGNTRTDVAMEAADVTISKDDPLLVPGVISLSKKTVKTIKENFAMSVGINSFALVLGATGILPPIYSSIIHNATTIFVVGNSLKLLKFDLEKNAI